MASKTICVLRRKQDFENLKLFGSRVTPCRWMLLSFISNNLECCRFGWTIGSKVGNAVIRNRLKRWCREYFRTTKSPLKNNLDLNVVIRPGNQDFYKSLRREEFHLQLERACLMVEKSFS